MDIQALMQAAQGGDPQAAQFIQQLLSGGTPLSQRLPEIQRQELVVPELAESGPNPGAGMGEGLGALGNLPVFDGVRARLGEMRDGWFNRGQGAPGGAGMGQPYGQVGVNPAGMAPPTSLGQGDPGMIGQMEGPPSPAQQMEAAGMGMPNLGQPGPQAPQAAPGLPQPQEGEDLITMIGRMLGKGGA